MNWDKIIKELVDISNEIVSSKHIEATNAEKEIERLFKELLPDSPFRNKAFAAGGYVRDEIMGIDSKDLDIVVEEEGGAEELTEWIHDQFPDAVTRPYQLGRGYPIWQITFKDDVEYEGEIYNTEGAVLEFADTQKEAFPDEESRQRQTEPGTLEEDVERRDFTINMLMKNLSTGEIEDLTGQSVKDIENKQLRGHPSVDFNKILKDDPLRMLRLIRFQAKYNMDVPKSVIKAVKNNAKRIKIVSEERIRDELTKLMDMGKLDKAIKMMKTVGLLQYVMPEIEELKDVEQGDSRGQHQEGDVWNHTMMVLQNAKPGIENQLAALLHDVGKPDTQEILDDRIQFLGHAEYSAQIAESIMRNLKFDNQTIDTVTNMVKNHMRAYDLEEASEKTLRKFIREVGDEMVDSILDLAEADQLGNLPPEQTIPDLRERIKNIEETPVSKEPVLQGKEIMNILDLEPGPVVGRAKEFLKDKEDEYISEGKEFTPEIAEKLLKEEFQQ